MIKKVLIFLILMSSATFFNVIFLPLQLSYLIQFGVPVMMFVVLVVQEIYGKGEMITHNFKYPIFLILTGVFLSMIIAQAYHGQSFLITTWAQRFMYFYVFYFFLHFLNPGIKDLEKILLAIGVIWALSYLVQYAIYPTVLFDVPLHDERGTLRIFLPGSRFLSLSLFYCLYKFYTRNKLSYIFLALTFLTILILQSTRNTLAATFLVIFMSLIFSNVIKSRYVIYFLILISLVPVYFLFADIFTDMIELTERQSANFQKNIRVRAATFFLTDFFPNNLAYLFGNGQHHGTSLYGMRVNAYSIYHGFYQGDVGLVGDFSKFGLFYVVGYLWILIKGFTIRLGPEYIYIKYFIGVVFLTLPFGTTSSSSIAIFCVLLYIIDKQIHELKEESGNKKNKLSDVVRE